MQYSPELRKQRQELEDYCHYQLCRNFLEKNLAIKIIMDCRATSAVNFKTKLGIHQHNPKMTLESILTININKNCDIIFN